MLPQEYVLKIENYILCVKIMNESSGVITINKYLVETIFIGTMEEIPYCRLKLESLIELL